MSEDVKSYPLHLPLDYCKSPVLRVRCRFPTTALPAGSCALILEDLCIFCVNIRYFSKMWKQLIVERETAKLVTVPGSKSGAQRYAIIYKQKSNLVLE